MSRNKPPLYCPHCGVAVAFRFMEYSTVSPGLLSCPACLQPVNFPLGIRYLALAAGLPVGLAAMAVLLRTGIWSTYTYGGVALKGVAFVLGCALMLVVMAYVCRATADRLVKNKRTPQGSPEEP